MESEQISNQLKIAYSEAIQNVSNMQKDILAQARLIRHEKNSEKRSVLQSNLDKMQEALNVAKQHLEEAKNAAGK